jgi:hypothetical protein
MDVCCFPSFPILINYIDVVNTKLQDSTGIMMDVRLKQIERVATTEELETTPWRKSPFRERSGGRPFLRFPVELSMDDFGKAKRGKWSPLLATYYSVANVPTSSSHAPVNAKCFSISGSKVTFETSLKILKDELKIVTDGFFTYCKAFNQMVFVESKLYIFAGDNAMGSKLCCHKGAMTFFYCRKCLASKEDPSVTGAMRISEDLHLQEPQFSAKGLSRQVLLICKIVKLMNI